MPHIALEFDSPEEIMAIARHIVNELNPKLRENLEMTEHHGTEYFIFTFYTCDETMIEFVTPERE